MAKLAERIMEESKLHENISGMMRGVCWRSLLPMDLSFLTESLVAAYGAAPREDDTTEEAVLASASAASTRDCTSVDLLLDSHAPG